MVYIKLTALTIASEEEKEAVALKKRAPPKRWEKRCYDVDPAAGLL